MDFIRPFCLFLNRQGKSLLFYNKVKKSTSTFNPEVSELIFMQT